MSPRGVIALAAVALTASFVTSRSAIAATHHHHHHARAVSSGAHKRYARHWHTHRHYADGRPGAWCGWYMRKLLGVADEALNLAANWAHWGQPVPGPAPGVIGVMPHHVFRVVRVVGPGRVLATSGNDGHAVRTRVRSTSGVIAWRQG